MKVPSFDLTEQFRQLRGDVLAALEEVMDQGQFVLGERVCRLEAEVARLTGTRRGIGVANGSDALHLALAACGVGPGDEVIVPAFTFFATAGSVARTGAKPVFVDVQPETFNLDPAQVEAAVTARTRAVIPVHLYGQAAPMEDLVRLARARGLQVIEDAAQAIGASRHGKPVCSFGDVGCLSFFPTKNLGAYGDGGMVVTQDQTLAEKVAVLRVHGSKPKYYHHVLGYNSRLDEIQAAILLVKAQRLEEWTKRRQDIARYYDNLIDHAELQDWVTAPAVDPDNVHVYHQYTVRAQRRDELRDFLAAQGVGTAVYYPLPLHLQPVFKDLGYQPGDLPISERLSREVLSLPMFPELKAEQQEFVVTKMAEFYGRHRQAS